LWDSAATTKLSEKPGDRRVRADDSAFGSAGGPVRLGLLAAAIALLHAGSLCAQDLEPRVYSVAPVGVNAAVLGYSYSVGDVPLDPTLPIEDVTATINGGSLGYFRAIDFFGRSANVGFVAPYLWGPIQGTAFGEFDRIRRSGLRDPRFRFGVNLRGAPAMNMKEFSQYRQKTNIGFSAIVVPPLGQYDPNRLINLGSNRWSFKPEIGISRAMGRWNLDFYAGAWLFTANNNFQGMQRTQKPIGSTQFHISYNVTPRLWAAFDVNFFAGGRSSVDGVAKLDLQRNSRVGGTVSIPVHGRHSIRLAVNTGAVTSIGADFTTLAFGYQFIWGAGL
jgi:hypothetical protein